MSKSVGSLHHGANGRSRSLAARFLTWWGRELAACLPSALRSGRRGRRRLLLTLENDTLAIVRERRRGKTRPVANIALRDPEQKESTKERSAVRRAARRSDEIAVRVPEPDALRRTVRLPLAAKENLREVIEFEMDRFMSLKADEVYFDYTVLEEDKTRQQLVISLIAVPRADLRAAFDFLSAWGIAPDRLALLDPKSQKEAGGNLLPPAPIATGLSWQARLAGALAAVLVLLLAGLAYLPWYEKQKELDALRIEEAAAREAALQVGELRAQVTAEAEHRRAIYAMLTARPPTIRVLDELSRAVPENTWLIDLQLAGDRVSFKGYSQEPAGVISALEASPLFHDARFISPVIPDTRSGLDRITISARLTGGEPKR